MNPWQRINTSKLSTTWRESVGGVEFDFSASPYDVPERFRHGYDRKICRYVIEFGYLTEERFERREIDEMLTLRVGRRSGRLLGIELNVKRLVEKTLAEALPRLKRAIDALGDSHRNRIRHYRIADEILAANSNIALHS